MSSAKIAISLEQDLLERLDRIVRELKLPSRSKAIQQAVLEKVLRLEKSRLARECARLTKTEERKFAEEGTGDLDDWPPY